MRSPLHESLLAGAAVSAPRAMPLICIAMGPHGAPSRALCPTLAPATHPRCLGTAAPGQISGAEMRAARAALGLKW
jgi:3-dehydroquinate dehydratase